MTLPKQKTRRRVAASVSEVPPQTPAASLNKGIATAACATHGSETNETQASVSERKTPTLPNFIEESPLDQPGILEMLEAYHTARKPVLLVGEPGVGKTLLVQTIAQRSDVPLIQKMGGDYGVSKLVGHFELRGDHGATTTRFVPGPLLRALDQGSVFYLDEIDSLNNDCFDVLHQLLDHRGQIAKADIGLEVRPGDDEFIRTHEDFWFVATCVDNGSRSGLPDDFLDRFRVIEIPRLSEKAQLNYLLQAHCEALGDDIRRIVRVGELTRRINWGKPASFRQVKSAVEDVANGIPVDYAIDHCLISPNADSDAELMTLKETLAIEKLGTTALLTRVTEKSRKLEVNEFNTDVLGLADALRLVDGDASDDMNTSHRDVDDWPEYDED